MNTDHKFSCLYEIIGITSFGAPCGSGLPGVYTRVSAYNEWIENIVWLGIDEAIEKSDPVKRQTSQQSKRISINSEFIV